jgi:rhodanese-related sulfurtransferase
MATKIAAERVTELVAEGAGLVEVLPRREYEQHHLRGAVSIPLKELDAEGTAGLDRGAAVIVYCWDSI